MKLQKTIDGSFAAPVTAPTTAAAPRVRELAADVLATTPELAKYLDFGPNAAPGASVPAVAQSALASAAGAAIGAQTGWQYDVELGALNGWTAVSSTK